MYHSLHLSSPSCHHVRPPTPFPFPLHLHLVDFADAFIQSDLQPFIHTFTHQRRKQPRRSKASSSEAVRVSRLAQGHLNTQLGAEDRTSHLLVTSQPILLPEL
jgi:hypothetical protein